MIKRIRFALFSVVLAATPLAANALTVTNKTPGAELLIAVRSPLHVRDLNTGGCKFAARGTTQELVSCPKLRTFQPGEHEIEITGPNGALCHFGFADLETGWDTRISGPCQTELQGKSTVVVTQRT